MSPYTPPRQVVYERRDPVDPRTLERELRHLWQEAEDESAKEGLRITKACLLNLTVYCMDEQAAQEASEAIGRLTRQHPCRAIVIQADPEATAPLLRAWVSARCYVAGADRQICCEQILVRVGGPAIEALPGLLQPLAVSDLPAFLWWRGTHAPDGRMWQRLGLGFDCLIVDACQGTHSEDELRALARLVGDDALRPRLLDLGWIRLAPWREAIAELFDAPWALKSLAQVRRVRIEFGCRPAALLLVGWLSSRLGWRLSDDEKSLVGGQGQAVELELVECRGEPDIKACALETGADPPTRFAVRREMSAAIALTTAGPNRPEERRQMSFKSFQLHETLCRALELLTGDPLLEEAVRSAARLAGVARIETAE